MALDLREGEAPAEPYAKRIQCFSRLSRSFALPIERHVVQSDCHWAPASSDNLARQEPREQCVPRQEPRNKDRRVGRGVNQAQNPPDSEYRVFLSCGPGVLFCEVA